MGASAWPARIATFRLIPLYRSSIISSYAAEQGEAKVHRRERSRSSQVYPFHCHPGADHCECNKLAADYWKRACVHRAHGLRSLDLSRRLGHKGSYGRVANSHGNGSDLLRSYGLSRLAAGSSEALSLPLPTSVSNLRLASHSFIIPNFLFFTLHSSFI